MQLVGEGNSGVGATAVEADADAAADVALEELSAAWEQDSMGLTREAREAVLRYARPSSSSRGGRRGVRNAALLSPRRVRARLGALRATLPGACVSRVLRRNPPALFLNPRAADGAHGARDGAGVEAEYAARVGANVELLRSLLVGWDVDKIVERAPRLLTCRTATLVGRLEALTTDLPRTTSVGLLVQRCPAVLLMQPRGVVARFEALARALPALNEEEVGLVACSSASLMTTSEATLERKAARLLAEAPELLDPELYSPASMGRFLGASATRMDRLVYMASLREGSADGDAAGAGVGAVLPTWPASRALTATDATFSAAFPGFKQWRDERLFWGMR
eukprot:PRCOL_00005392-RA